MLPPANTDLLARELSGPLDGSACLQIKLPALGEVEAGQSQGHRNEHGQGQGNEHGQSQRDEHRQGHGLALSRWRGLGI
ncbi:hypothetical protein [Prochlorococcus sp. MIT 1312]|uniref:hypothetical protein n=1 Tax=Prochlorococcus sp. MIT 1312 TaxID=3082537 RepID=UPI0039B0290A